MNGRVLSPTKQAFFDEYALWIALSLEEQDQADVRPLMKAAARHLQLGRELPLPELAPCLAALYFAVAEWDYPFLLRWIVEFTAWFLRVAVYRGRPMWNDFWMALWQLSRDPRYIGCLHSHLKTANSIQLETGHWMVTSVCQQDPVFAEHWADVISERGEVFA